MAIGTQTALCSLVGLPCSSVQFPCPITNVRQAHHRLELRPSVDNVSRLSASLLGCGHRDLPRQSPLLCVLAEPASPAATVSTPRRKGRIGQPRTTFEWPGVLGGPSRDVHAPLHELGPARCSHMARTPRSLWDSYVWRAPRQIDLGKMCPKSSSALDAMQRSVSYGSCRRYPIIFGACKFCVTLCADVMTLADH